MHFLSVLKFVSVRTTGIDIQACQTHANDESASIEHRREAVATQRRVKRLKIMILRFPPAGALFERFSSSFQLERQALTSKLAKHMRIMHPHRLNTVVKLLPHNAV